METALTMTNQAAQSNEVVDTKQQIKKSIRVIKQSTKTINEAFSKLSKQDKKLFKKVNYKKLYKEFVANRTGDSIKDRAWLKQHIISAKKTGIELTPAIDNLLTTKAAAITDMFAEMNNLKNLNISNIDKIKNPKLWLKVAVAITAIAAIFGGTARYTNTQTSQPTKPGKPKTEVGIPATNSGDSTSSAVNEENPIEGGGDDPKDEEGEIGKPKEPEQKDTIKTTKLKVEDFNKSEAEKRVAENSGGVETEDEFGFGDIDAEIEATKKEEEKIDEEIEATKERVENKKEDLTATKERVENKKEDLTATKKEEKEIDKETAKVNAEIEKLKGEKGE